MKSAGCSFSSAKLVSNSWYVLYVMSPPFSDTVNPAIEFRILKLFNSQFFDRNRAETSPSFCLNKENSTCLTNDNNPLSAMFPGSQNALFSFFFTLAALSIKSILESSSDDDILQPAKPGTIKLKRR